MNYMLIDSTAWLRHGHTSLNGSLLYDIGATGPDELQALVASGDCFEVFASRLDEVALTLHHKQQRLQLEALIHTLLELQRNYSIVQKKPDRARSPFPLNSQ